MKETELRDHFDADDQESISAAERALWEVFKADLISMGRPGDLMCLRTLHTVRPAQVNRAGQWKRVVFDVYSKLSDYSADYNARTGEQVTWFFYALMEKLGRDMDEDTGKKLAEKAASPPSSAVLVKAAYEEHGGQPVFIARWKHSHEGVPVERDFIQVMINGRNRKVFSVIKRWHRIKLEPTPR